MHTALDPSENLERLLAKVSAEVRLRRLEAPVIFLLEMYKPLSGVAAVAIIISRPLAALLLGVEGAAAAERLFESRENIERLITLLEDKHGR